MNISLKLKCICENEGFYDATNRYHPESCEDYIDVTEAINDKSFQAKPSSVGTSILCKSCNKEYEVI